MEINQKIEEETKEKQKAFSALHTIMINTMSEDNDLSEQEWYKRIGLSEEDKEKKFSGFTEKEINQYMIYSTKRARLVSQLSLKKELTTFLSMLQCLDVISKEEKNND